MDPKINKTPLTRKEMRAARKAMQQEVILSNMYSTSKLLMWVMTFNGILWIWCSYILAFMDKVQIAESLSSNVCTVVLGQIITYFASKTMENIFKYNVDKIFNRKGAIINGSESETAEPEDFSGVEPEYVAEPLDVG